MKYLKLFESFDIKDDINLTILNLSDSSSNLFRILNIKTNEIFLYDLNISGDEYDVEEANIADARLGDMGYKILQIGRTCNGSTWLCSVIKKDFYDKLIDNDIVLWKDLKWEDWHLNTSMSFMTDLIGDGHQIDVKQCKLNLDTGVFNDKLNEVYHISILSGKKSSYTQNEIEIYDGESDPRYTNSCEAEIELIKMQLKYFGIS